MNLAAESPSTTIDKIRHMFRSGQILTSCGAAESYATADLRKIISVLRASGMDIVDRWKKSKGGKRYKEYFLREFTPKDEAPPIEPNPEILPVIPMNDTILPPSVTNAIQGEQLKQSKDIQPSIQQKLF